jgi:hypothetical protein
MTKPIDVTVFGPAGEGQIEAGPEAPAVEAGAWARYFSRMLDVTLGQYAAGIVLGIVLGLTAPQLGDVVFKGFTGDVLLPLATLPLVMAADSVVLAVFGNTLGRKIAGLRVETRDHRRPGLLVCLTRNALIYLQGFGLGIPLVSLIALINAVNEAQDSGGNPWDKQLRTRVYVRGGNSWRTGIVAALFFLGNGVPYILRVIQTAAGAG